ncbi:MAG: ABC transporter ATP-binding protein [Pseudomonadota bacterium]
MSGATPLFEARSISKSFGDVRANQDISFQVMPGEIHALLGENGAGKSTLVKCIYGVISPDSGTFVMRGEPVRIASPHQARALGVGMVFQHFSLFDALTVAENIELALDTKMKRVDLISSIKELSETYGLDVVPDRAVHTLSVGERQRVEIVRVLMQSPDFLIFDEPTSVLTPQEADALFVTIKQLAAGGKGVLYISHRLDEIRAFCDTATILRHGKLVGMADPKVESSRSLAAMMVGADVADIEPNSSDTGSSPIAINVTKLSVASDQIFGVSLRDISFSVSEGQILGIAGIAGNGQSELFAALSGETKTDHQSVEFFGKPVGVLDISARRGTGAAFIPEERNGHSAVSHFTLAENIVLTRHATTPVVNFGLISRSKSGAMAGDVIGAFDVRTTGAEAHASSLSGGNLQKFSVGREIIEKPKILVVNQPTWGVDAGAARVIRQALIDLAKEGTAVIVISQDLDELFTLATDISVLNQGALSNPRPVGEISRDEIGLLMGGVVEGRKEQVAHGA